MVLIEKEGPEGAISGRLRTNATTSLERRVLARLGLCRPSAKKPLAINEPQVLLLEMTWADPEVL